MIIPAAGSGTRLGAPEPKAWTLLGARPLLSYALETFRHHPGVSEIILVVGAAEMERALALLATGPDHLSEKVVLGGAERQESVWLGLQEVDPDAEMVLIHDAARPFISSTVIDRCVETIRNYGAAVVSHRLADTVKQVDTDNIIRATIPRETLWGAQTPQGFRTGLIMDAYQQARAEKWIVTDDAALVEKTGHAVRIVEGEVMNFKITTPEDLAMAERLLTPVPRIGFGYDVHRLVERRKLILGGVTIPHHLGLLGHSDADVLVHALMDALLGAAALGDIGQHFPDTDERYRGADSLHLLAEVGRIIATAGYAISNVDVTLAAERPKIAPHIAKMRENIATALSINTTKVSIKATTAEGLGFVGGEEGMSAYAVATVIQK